MAADLGSESNPIAIELEASDGSKIVIVKLSRLWVNTWRLKHLLNIMLFLLNIWFASWWKKTLQAQSVI